MTRFSSVASGGSYPFADTTKVDLLSRQRSALGAQVPHIRSGTLRWRTLSASAPPDRSTQAKAMMMRMGVIRAVSNRQLYLRRHAFFQPATQPRRRFLPDTGTDR